MRPGITEIEGGIEKDSLVSIVDVINKKVIAIGISLFSSEELEKTNSGKAIKTIHYTGDDIWTMKG